MAKKFTFDDAITTDIKGAASNSYIDNIKMIKIADIETNAENFYSLPDIEDLAEDIDRQGLIHSLAVAKISSEKYKLISGHRRLTAIKLLIENGKWNNETVPCYVITAKKSDAEMNLDLIMLNHTQRKYSDADIFKEHEELKKIFTQLEADGVEIKGRLREKIAKAMHVSSAQIKALEQDLATAKAHPKPSDDSFVGIEIDGKYISEKADAGKAILEFCKQMNNPDPIAIGKYRGFDMELQFSSGVVHCYEIALKGATTQKVSLGEDANGNITRIDNAIGRLSEHIENAKVELKNIQTQYETAQIEVQKPFAQEEELKAKTKRQIEVEKLISSGENEPEQNAISDYYYFSATDEQINALNNASIPFEKQTKADGSMVIRVATDDKSKAEAIMNSKNLIL